MNPEETILTEAEESALVLRLPDEEAATQLVMRTLPNAVKYLNRVCRGSKSEPELISMCYAALRKSVRNVKPGKGRFMIYSKIYLRSAMFSSWKGTSTVRGVERADVINLDQHFMDSFRSKLQKKPTVERDDGAHELPEPCDSLAQEFEFDQINVSELWTLAEKIIRRVLTDHEKLIMQLRFKLDYSFEEIASFLGVTRSAAQGSCERALKKIRVEMAKTEGLS